MDGFVENLNAKCSYIDVIKFLSCVTSAHKSFSWKTEIENVSTAFTGAIDFFKHIKDRR